MILKHTNMGFRRPFSLARFRIGAEYPQWNASPVHKQYIRLKSVRDAVSDKTSRADSVSSDRPLAVLAAMEKLAIKAYFNGASKCR